MASLTKPIYKSAVHHLFLLEPYQWILQTPSYRWLPLNSFSSTAQHHIFCSILLKKMECVLTVATTLLHERSNVGQANDTGIPSVRIHLRALVLRDGRDCSKLVIYCGKVAGACNDTCYHINCVDKNSATMVYVHTLDVFALLMVIPAPIPVIPTRRIMKSPDAELLTVPVATKYCPAKNFAIR